MKPMFALLLAGLVAGCAGSTGQLSILEQNGSLSVGPATAPGYDYTVSIRRTRDFDYDTIDQSTRDEIALRYIRNQCPGATIMGEDAVDLGAGPIIGVKRATYLIRIKCN